VNGLTRSSGDFGAHVLRPRTKLEKALQKVTSTVVAFCMLMSYLAPAGLVLAAPFVAPSAAVAAVAAGDAAAMAEAQAATQGSGTRSDQIPPFTNKAPVLAAEPKNTTKIGRAHV
jgi:hypothetical protein